MNVSEKGSGVGWRLEKERTKVVVLGPKFKKKFVMQKKATKAVKIASVVRLILTPRLLLTSRCVIDERIVRETCKVGG